MGHVWRAGPRHDSFNNAWANPTQAMCGAWVVATACSAGPAPAQFFLFYKNSYIHIYNLYSIL
jgi:hypothetical protein